jgi:hypothetical protein
MRLNVHDDGVRKSRKTGRGLFLSVVVPPWCLVVNSDAEFDEIVLAAVLVGLVVACLKLGHVEKPCMDRLRSVAKTPRVRELYEPFLRSPRGFAVER